MWLKKIMNIARLKCFLIILGLNFQQGFSQNAEAGGSLERNGLERTTLGRRYNGSILASNISSATTQTTKQTFNWELPFPKSDEALDERKGLLARNAAAESEVLPPRAMGNKEDKELSSTLASLSKEEEISNPAIDTTTLPTTFPRRRNRGKGGERRRRLKQFLAIMSRGNENNATTSELEAVSSGLDFRRGVNIELNNVERPKKDRLNTQRGKAALRKKPSGSKLGRDKKLQEARERRKKLRMDRRRRRTRERRRRNKLHYDNQRGKGRRARKQKQLHSQPAALFQEKLAASPESNVTKVAFKNARPDTVLTEPNLPGSNIKSSNESVVEKVESLRKRVSLNRQPDQPINSESNHTKEIFNVEHHKHNNGENVAEHHEDQNNVEREFSKQFERELSKAAQINHESLANPSSRINENLVNSRLSGERILGYSKTENAFPSNEAGNEVLSKNLKSYHDHIANDIRASKFPSSHLYSMYTVAKLRWNSFVENSNISGLMAGDHPILPEQERHDFENLSKRFNDTSSINSGTETVMEDVDDDNLKGDLSCINGTFLPAPLVRYALIKYVKSSTPGHEYLEADYECTPGYNMVTKTRRLLCNNRRWVGGMPKCKLTQNINDVCANSPCEQVCKDVNGDPMCACYKGFRQEGSKCIDINECEKGNGGCEYTCINIPGSYRCECPRGMRQGENRYTCMDINECLLNNGHGPCQDTCHNVDGGYRCSCQGLPGTVLGSDNHTCQDAGPCGTNNAGCSHTCLSTMGRVFCLCPDGFMLEDDWKTCQDVDECAVPDLQSVVCQHGCINTPGSYRCAESPEIRDHQPLNLVSNPCDPGFEPSVNGGCVDINECAVSNGGCLEVCENTAGSYFCACDGDERLLSADGKTCVDINDVACPALNPSGRGYVMCSRLTTPKPWRGRKRVINRPGTKCFLRCPYGYQLRGEYELTCGTNGNWLGSRHGECVRYSKPRLDCPPNLIAEVPPGQSEAFVTFAQPSTDLDWFRYVRSEPSWGTRLEANLVPGEHVVTFIAKHPVSKKQASCTLRISIKAGEAPRIKNCPKNILVHNKNGTIVTWTEPIFTDNVKIANVISNENPGHLFTVGEHKINYEASDEAGWTATCDFLVTIRGD